MGDSELRIVASQEIGQFGRKEGAPVLFRWHWYYHAGMTPLWALVILLLAIPKANRHRQAWLILCPLGLVMLLWHPLVVLFGMGEATAQVVGCTVVSGAVSLAVVWLMGHRLGSRYGMATFFRILAIMLGVGALSLFCRGEVDEASAPFAAYAITYSFAVVSLIIAMMLAGRFCRKRLSAIRFGLWLLGWMLAITVGLAIIVFFAVESFYGGGPRNLVRGLIVVPVMAAFIAGIVYLFNLPFLVLALGSPFYRERLKAMFCVDKHGTICLPTTSQCNGGETDSEMP